MCNVCVIHNSKSKKMSVCETIKYYSGCISYRVGSESARYIAKVCSRKKNNKYGESLSFSFDLAKWKKNPQIRQIAKNEALEWIKEKNAKYKCGVFQKVKILSKEEKEFLSGFADGDACVEFTKKLVAGVYQSSGTKDFPEILKVYNSAFSGTRIELSNRKRIGVKGNRNKPEYRWRLTGKMCLPFLQMMRDHSIIKLPQASLGIECIEESQNESWQHQMRYKNKEFYTDLFSKMKKEYANIDIDITRLTIPYIAGLFDADGSIYYRTSTCPAVRITQKGCPRILVKINEKLGNIGTVSEGEFTVQSQGNVYDLLLDIVPYLVEKKQQGLIAIAKLEEERENKMKRKWDEVDDDYITSSKLKEMKMYTTNGYTCNTNYTFISRIIVKYMNVNEDDYGSIGIYESLIKFIDAKNLNFNIIQSIL